MRSYLIGAGLGALLLTLGVWSDVIHYYGTGVALGPVYVDWYYLVHGEGSVWWFPGDNV